MNKIKLKIQNETGKLNAVVFGIARDRGAIIHQINPKIRENVEKGTYPIENDLINQVDSTAKILKENGVEVFRPANLVAQDQIFARDIAFVIGDKIIKSNMKKQSREPELEGIKYILNRIDSEKILEPNDNANIEGGDVIIHGKYIFVGLGERTNYEGYRFVLDNFPEYEVIPFKLVVSNDPYQNILHLDCAFQPVGDKYAIIYENGFVRRPDHIYDIFGEDNLIKVDKMEMYYMNPNIFSIAPDKVISETHFSRLNGELRKRNIEVIETNYDEVAKVGGLLRCSTMPLNRE